MGLFDDDDQERKFTAEQLQKILDVARIFDDNGYEILGEQLHYVHENESMKHEKG